MKYRPSKRVIWLIIPLLPVMIMFAVVWLSGESEETFIASRGSRPPPSRVLSKPLDWCDDGFSAWMTWELNPWKTPPGDHFGTRFLSLSRSNDPEDRKKARELMKLGKEWYERILARYPELAVTYKDLPEERNGLLQWKRFEKRLKDGKNESSSSPITLPRELFNHFGVPNGKSPWSPQTAKAWLDENRAIIDEARAIALMPDRSSKIFPGDDPAASYSSVPVDFTRIFLMEARLLAEQDDIDGALESIRAAKGIANHLRDGEAPSFMQALQGAYIQKSIERYVFSDILPGLPAGRFDMTAWEDAVNPKLQQPADFTRIIRGDWNTMMPEYLLPAMADPGAPGTPNDGEALAEAFTRSYQTLVTQNETLALSDLPSHPTILPSHHDLTRRSREIAKDSGMTSDGFDRRASWERSQIQTGMTQAAFAILKGDPVPVDPIRGQPYVWDPVTRKLSAPDIPEYKRSGVKPMVLPHF